MSETIQEISEQKKKDFVQVIYGFFVDFGISPFMFLILNSASQGARDGIYHLEVQNSFTKLGNNFCDPILWSAYMDFNRDLNLVPLLAFGALFLLNFRQWFPSIDPKTTDGLLARKTMSQLLLMAVAYHIVLAIIHIFTVNNFLKHALPQCSLPLSEKDMEAAMSSGFNNLLWLTIAVSVVFVIIANLFMRRRFPRPNPWKNDDKIQA